MNYGVKFFLFIAFLLNSTTSTIAQVNLSNGLVAHWNFNGDANDISGNANHGTPYNLTPAAGKAGIPNTAYYFGGAGSFIEVLDAANLNFNMIFSIHTRISPKGFYQGYCHGNCIIGKGNFANIPGNYSLLYSDGPFLNGTNCNTGVPVDAEHQNFYIQRVSTGGTPLAPYTPYIDNNDFSKWYSVTAVSDGINFKIYIDGQLVSTNPAINVSGTNSHNMFIGKRNNNTNTYWLNATIDEIRLYNRALNQDEADSLSKIVDVAPDGIKEQTKNMAEISISPNPVNGQFQLLTTTTDIKDAVIKISDMHGRVLRTWSAKSLGNMSFDITDFVAGYYIVRISNADGQLQKKLIKF